MISYELAKALKDEGFPQNIRRHINAYGTIFYTRKVTDYPIYPSASQIRVALVERYSNFLIGIQRMAGDDAVEEQFAEKYVDYTF